MDELAAVGFASMGDYLRPGENGAPVPSFADLTPRQMAAVSEVTVESVTVGSGASARTVTRTRFKLHQKQPALTALAAMNGWDTPALDSPEGQIDVEKRARVRAEMLELLADMARPRPRLIEGAAAAG